MIVDSYRFLIRSFRPYYEGRGTLSGEDQPVWAAFEKRLSKSRIALLTSAGLYLESTQQPFDLERERSDPEWGDPSWRSIPADTPAPEIAVAHLHLNDQDIRADPEIALPAQLLTRLVTEGVIGSTTTEHLSVMGYQDRGLKAWREHTAPEIVAILRDWQADGVILAPA